MKQVQPLGRIHSNGHLGDLRNAFDTLNETERLRREAQRRAQEAHRNLVTEVVKAGCHDALSVKKSVLNRILR